MAEIRLQRFLAQAGFASRRRCEGLIAAGKVRVNGTIVRELGTKVDPGRDRVTCDGQRVVAEDKMWLLLNKPRGCVSTASDPQARQTVLDLVGEQGVRLYPVGRLDYHTEGVILLTNDGELANALMHPRRGIARVYHVKLRGIIDPDELDPLRRGVALETGETVSAEVRGLGTTEKHSWVEMTIHQGRNRQIHRMIEAIGGTVLKLVRVSYAGLTAEGVRPGRYRALSQGEINALRKLAGLEGSTKRAGARLPGRRSRRRGSRRSR